MPWVEAFSSEPVQRSGESRSFRSKFNFKFIMRKPFINVKTERVSLCMDSGRGVGVFLRSQSSWWRKDSRFYGKKSVLI